MFVHKQTHIHTHTDMRTVQQAEVLTKGSAGGEKIISEESVIIIIIIFTG